MSSAEEVLNLVKPQWSKELPVLNITDHFKSTFELKLNMINWLDDCHTLNLADIEYRKKEEDTENRAFHFKGKGLVLSNTDSIFLFITIFNIGQVKGVTIV